MAEAAPFDLNEYARASTEFFSTATRALVSGGDGLLSQIASESVEAMTPLQSTLDTGEVIPSPPVKASSLVSMSISDGIVGDFDDIHLAISNLAEAHEKQVVPQMLAHISAICEGTGNVVDGGGRSIWEAQLEMLETISINFDSDGTPSLPQLVVHPDTAAKLGEPPPGFQERYQQVIERRRDEWMAGRRTRRLPRDGH